MVLTKRTYYKFLIGCSVCLVLMLYIATRHSIPKYSFSLNGDAKKLRNVRGYVVDNLECRVPYKDPWDSLIKRFIRNVTEIRCRSDYPVLVESNHTTLFVTAAYFALKRSSAKEEVSCCYRTLRRNPPYTNKVDFHEPYVGTSCTKFEKIDMNIEEFLQVECTRNKQLIFVDVFAFVPLKPNVEIRCKMKEDKVGSEWSKPNVSVLIIGIDSLSRLHFYRHMQRTRDKLEELDAVELQLHNTQSNETVHNLTPLLTGHTVAELAELCIDDVDLIMDECPFIWKTFENAGYRTAYGEDASWMNTYNIMGLHGFQNIPTDYYLRPYMIYSEEYFGNFLDENSKTFLCINSRHTWDEFLKYISKFIKSMSNRRYFSFFWCSSLAHDNINNTVLGDKSYEEFLRTYKESNLSEEAVLIFMSDHGKRHQRMQTTYQGQLELRLPFAYFIFPEWFKKTYRKATQNFRSNSRRLTSHLDIYQTVLDLLNLTRLTDDYIERRTEINTNSTHQKGQSLFLPISSFRTCADADVSEEWCSCQHSAPLSLTDEFVRNAAQVSVNHMNTVISPDRRCAHLILAEVLDARVDFPSKFMYNENVNEGAVKDCHIMFRVVPGNMTINSTLRYHLESEVSYVLASEVKVVSYGSEYKSCGNGGPYCSC